MADILLQVVVKVEVNDPDDETDVNDAMEELEESIEQDVIVGVGSVTVVGIKEHPPNERI